MVHNGLDVMQWRHLEGGGLEGSMHPPRIYDFSFPCKSYLWNSVTAAKKNNTLRRLRPPMVTETPNDLLKWVPWRDATSDSGINDQLIKMHSTHSWIKCVLSSLISYFVVCCFQRKMFNTTKLLYHMAPFCGIDNAQVSNMILIITA